MAKEEFSDPKDYQMGFREGFKIYAWVWRELMGEKGKRAVKRLILCLCLGNLISMTVPWMLGRMDSALRSGNGASTNLLFGGIAFVLLTRRVIQYFESHQREIMFGEKQGTIDLRTIALFFGISIGQHLRENDLLSASSLDKGRARANESMGMLPTEGGETLFLIGTSYIALWFINPLAGAVSTIMLGISITWSLRINRRIVKVTLPYEREFQKINRAQHERLRYVQRVKTFGKEAEELAEFRRRWDAIIAKDRSFWFWVADQNTLRNLLNTVIFLVVIWWSLRTIDTAHEGYNTLLPLFIWMHNIVDNLWRLGNLEHRMNWNLPSIRAMREALTMAPDITDRPDAKEVDDANGLHYQLVSVSSTYRPGKNREIEGETGNLVLKDVNLDMPPGTVLAVMGPSGSGKSTLIRIMRRDLDPEGGSVRINGDDLRDVRHASLLRCTSNIPQESVIFSGTIRDNLVWALPLEQQKQVSDEELWALIQALGLHTRLTHGLDTVVGEGGIDLSGGEAQRLMIGAAFVRKKASCLFIDEASSSLDATTERAVQRLLKLVLARGKSAVIIAHRLSTVRNICNKFLVMRPVNLLKPGESQIEIIADTFAEAYAGSTTLRRMANDQDIFLS